MIYTKMIYIKRPIDKHQFGHLSLKSCSYKAFCNIFWKINILNHIFAAYIIHFSVKIILLSVFKNPSYNGPMDSNQLFLNCQKRML